MLAVGRCTGGPVGRDHRDGYQAEPAVAGFPVAGRHGPLRVLYSWRCTPPARSSSASAQSPPRLRADLPYPGGLFRVRAGIDRHPGDPHDAPAPTSTSSTPPCATAPSARASATPSPTSSPSRGCWTRSASGSSRAAGPGALPKDTEFFARARTELKLRHAQLVAFGATRKAGVRVEDDPQVRALLDAETPVVCLVAKSDVRHVREALRTTLEENLAMVADTVAFFVGHGRRVFLDCEHFFDGYAHDPRLRRPGAARPRSPPAPRSASCATPTAACCRWASGRVVADVRARVERQARASTARTTPGAPSPTRWPPSRPGSPTCRGRRTATASGRATPTRSR